MAGEHSIRCYLAQMRQELVVNLVHSRIHDERIAPGQEVHFRSQYLKVANAIGLHLPSPETIPGLNAEHEAIVNLIEQYIDFHFTPTTIFYYLDQAIFSMLRCEGYKGLLDDGRSYLYENYHSWQDYLTSVLGGKSAMSKFLVCDDEGNVIGIDEYFIRQQLFFILNKNHYFLNFSQKDKVDALIQSLTYEREGLVCFTNYASIDTVTQGPMLLNQLERKLQIFTLENFKRIKIHFSNEKSRSQNNF